MKPSRSDIIPVLAVMAGGSFGALAVGALLLGSPDVDVRTPTVIVAPDVGVRSEVHVIGRPHQVREVRISRDAIAVSADRQWTALRIDENSTEVSSIEVESRPQIYVDGVRVETMTVEQLDGDDVARVEVIKGPRAATEYGSDETAGVILITTKAAESNDP